MQIKSFITLNVVGFCVKDFCFIPGKKSLTSPGKGKASLQVKEQEVEKQTCSVTLQTPGEMPCTGKLWM